MQGWKVTRQTPMSGGVNIEYQTDDGGTHYVFVGSADYSVARVKQLISEQVATHEAVAQLNSRA